MNDENIDLVMRTTFDNISSLQVLNSITFKKLEKLTEENAENVDLVLENLRTQLEMQENLARLTLEFTGIDEEY